MPEHPSEDGSHGHDAGESASSTAAAAVPAGKSRAAGRILMALAWLVLCGGGFLAAFLWPGAAQQAYGRLVEVVAHAGLLGHAVAAAAFTLVAATGIVPASLVGIAAGALYGTVAGLPLATACTLAGAALSFWLSRSVLRPAIAEYVDRRPRWRRFDTHLARDSWRLVGLLRISPVMPFAATSFALGLSSIAFGPYLAGTLAALPSLFGLVALGDAAGGLTVTGLGSFGPFRIALLAIGGIATILVSARLGRSLLAPVDPEDGPASTTRRP